MFSKVCAKCGKSEEIVNDPVPTHEEEMRLQQQMDRDLKLLPERKRRTFLRKLERNEEGTKLNRISHFNFRRMFP